MPGWIGPWEILILLVVVLLVFGPKRLPEMGRSMGRGMREFKNSVTGKDEEPKAELTTAPAIEEHVRTPTPVSSKREHDSI